MEISSNTDAPVVGVGIPDLHLTIGYKAVAAGGLEPEFFVQASTHTFIAPTNCQ